MRWYLPSWNGDVRAEQAADDPFRSWLTVTKPTLGELRALTGPDGLKAKLVKKGWLEEKTQLWDEESGTDPQVTKIYAPLSKLGPVLVKAFKPGKQTLTAIKLSGGKIETVQGTDAALDEAAETKIEKAEAVATVKRATPCCPQCMPGAVGPATEVLLTFLTEEQHREWAGDRFILVHGSHTGHRYLLAHRNTPRAARMGRICYDLEDELVIHFHDHSVPPEEEVLGAKLVLEHCEPWLRNEATVLEGRTGDWRNPPNVQYFQNPLGPGIADGTGDSTITHAIGGAVLGATGNTGLVLEGLESLG